MLDSNWDLINGQDAHDIEVLNHANQINVLEALVKFLLHHDQTPKGAGCRLFPNTQALQELHRTGTLFLLDKPGEWREIDVQIGKPDGTVIHAPPKWQEVAPLVGLFMQELGGKWPTSSPIQIAAFTLWKINWIHPFKNGNGRCARAFTYACLCLKYGIMLPGAPTVIDLIMADKPPFEAVLKQADNSFAQTGTADLGPMETYIEWLVTRQLSSIAP